MSAEAGSDPNVERGKDLTIRFNTKRCIHSRHCVLDAPQVFQANTPGRWLHPDAASVEHIVGVAHNCPSGAMYSTWVFLRAPLSAWQKLSVKKAPRISVKTIAKILRMR